MGKLPRRSQDTAPRSNVSTQDTRLSSDNGISEGNKSKRRSNLSRRPRQQRPMEKTVVALTSVADGGRRKGSKGALNNSNSAKVPKGANKADESKTESRKTKGMENTKGAKVLERDGKVLRSRCKITAVQGSPESTASSVTNRSALPHAAVEEEEREKKEKGDINQGENGGDQALQPEGSSTWQSTRENIISNLKDESSDIHIITGKTKKERCTKIWRKYASNFEEKTVVASIGRLLLQQSKNEGAFSNAKKCGRREKDAVGAPVWKTRKETSKAYSLLYQLRLHHEKGSGTKKLMADQIYKHHKIFHQYPIESFREWDKNMVKLTNIHREQIEDDKACFEQHRMMCPPKTTTSRGKPFWNVHAAKELLHDDVKSGKHCQMKPKKLWESKKEYQDFSLDDFRKHIYQEKYRQIAGPYWQNKRNIIARVQHEKDVEEMVQQWHHTKWEDDMKDLVQ